MHCPLVLCKKTIIEKSVKATRRGKWDGCGMHVADSALGMAGWSPSLFSAVFKQCIIKY